MTKHEKEEILRSARIKAKNEKAAKKAAKKQAKLDKKFKRNPYRIKWGRLILKTGLAVGLAGTFGVGIYVYEVLQDVPTVRQDTLSSDSSSNMYAADGTLIWTSAEHKRDYIKAKDIPNDYKNLLLSTEDKEFYSNHGFNPKGLINAGISLVKSKLGMGEARGGSGIEQQLIKLSVFSTSEADRTVSRKIKELFLSMQLDSNYSKDQILEYYVNKIYMGEGSYGANTIARTYFGKNLGELTLSQQAIIAGLGQAPGAYNLYDSPDLVRDRRNQVLNATYENGKISKADRDAALATEITEGLLPRNSQAIEVDKETSKHNGFVTSALSQVKELGYDMEKTPLQVYTTLDRNVENQVQDIVNGRTDLFQDEVQQAAVTVVDPRTGDVLSEIAGRNANKIGGLNRATQRNRSTGSSIKPLLSYGPAVEYLNWDSGKVLDGSPYTYVGTNVTATDYGGVTHGATPMQVALRNSFNTPAIRTLNDVGEVRAKQFLNNVGIQTDQQLSESTALGLNASTTQMASAMGTFGQGGVHHKTRYVSKVEFSDKSVKEIKFEANRAMRESTAFIMTEMLKGVPSEKGTMPEGKIPGVTHAVKTGTVGYPIEANVPAMAAMDIWAVGYTKSLSIAVWQGYDTPMEPGHYMSQYYSLNVGHLLYKTLMETLSQGRDNSDWAKPDTVRKGGGEGLDATYAPIDTPPTDEGKELTRPSVEVKDYDNAIKEDVDTSKMKAKMPATPEVPKDYKEGQWQKDLEAEKAKFDEEHKNDKEEAKIVGEDE